MQEKFDHMIELYNELKEEIRRKDKYLYEQWKAGGFIVDDDIMSMYPSLPKVIERLTNEEEEESDED